MKFYVIPAMVSCLLMLAGCFPQESADSKEEGETPSCCQTGTSRSKLFSKTGADSETAGEAPSQTETPKTEPNK